VTPAQEDPALSDPRRAPLDGIRVLDLTRFIAGPYCTMLLADQGADVVKVEPPRGEDTRRIPPMLGPGVSGYFVRYNRSKRSVCLDMKSPAGLAAFRELVRGVDVLVENFRPGVLERMGLDWAALRQLNSRLVYCTITGFGYEDSPLRDRGAFTPVVEAMSGAVIHQERLDAPLVAGYPVGDIFPAALACAAISSALFRRERDGEGSRVDVAMYDAMLAMNERAIAMSAMLGRNILPGVRADIGSTPAEIFAARDGYVSIAVVGEDIWQRFCKAIDRPDWAQDEALGSGMLRGAAFDSTIQPGIHAWLSDKSADEAVELLTTAGVPSTALRLPLEVLESEQALARGMITRVGSPVGAAARVVASPIRFGAEPAPPPGPAPELGRHTVDVLRDWAGRDEAEVAALLDSGAARQAP
jgi:crotonobetainyl-CoA:carnitine CoA-transferase CaiB-like acyl-CoA transferase